MTDWGERMRGMLDRLRGEPTPEEKARYLKSTRRAIFIEEEAAAIERRLDEGVEALRIAARREGDEWQRRMDGEGR